MVKQVVVLVGGLGTRLGSLTANTPKPMIPVGGRPFLDYILDEIGRQGFSEILLLTGYKSEAIVERYDGTQRRGARVSCVRETSPLGTGGALKNAAVFLDDAFVMMNGDTFFDINLRGLVKEAKSVDGIGTLALRTVAGDRYGTVDWDGDLILSFAERGKSSLINGGIYVLKKAVLDHIAKLPASIEADVFPALAEKRMLHGRKFENFFIDIGIPQALEEAQTSVPAQVRRPVVLFGKGVLVEDGALRWKAGAVEAIRALNDAGWLAFLEDGASFAGGAWMGETLASDGAHLDGVLSPDGAEKGLKEFGADVDRWFAIGVPGAKPAGPMKIEGAALDAVQSILKKSSENRRGR